MKHAPFLVAGYLGRLGLRNRPSSLVAARLIGGAIAMHFAFARAFEMLGFTDDLRGLAAGRRLIMQAVGGTLVVRISGLFT